jgi:general secretion pathway protein A
MYEEFFEYFGLQHNPFHVSPDAKRFFSTVAHDEALLQLVFGIESRQGLLVFTGEPGTGKTTILHYLLDWLDQYKYSTAYVFHTLLPSMDLLRLIMRDFGISCPSRNKNDLLNALKQWLLKRHAAGDCPVIVIDEAQALTSRALDELQLLLNLEDRGKRLVQLVLAGQPQLEVKLRRRRLAELRQRINCHCKLRSLTLEETSGYIASRLSGAVRAEVSGTVSGAGTTVNVAGTFPPEVVTDIYRYSKGIPRVVNLFCEHALLGAYADRRNATSCDDVLRVAQQFDLGGETAEPYGRVTFSRLIPYPGLGAVVVAASSPETAGLVTAEISPMAEEPLAAMAEAAATDAVLPDAAEISVQSGLANIPSVMRARGGLRAYWGGVVRTVQRDAGEFLRQCAAWLQKPLRKEPLTRASLRNSIGAICDWLRVPLGSTQLPGDAPSVPSAAHKHT